MKLPIHNYTRPEEEPLRSLCSIAAATLHEVMGRSNELPSGIVSRDNRFRIAGPACTVFTPARSNLKIHEAIYQAKPGDVLIVKTAGCQDAGYWGEIMNTAAIARQLGGLVIDAAIRDVDALRYQGFPVFSRGVTLRGTEKYPGGWINRPLYFDNAIVHPGDYLVGDEDGVVVVPRDSAFEILDAAKAREEKEAGVIKRLLSGESTLDIYGFS